MRFGTDGVRAVANTELTPQFALALGRACVRVFSPDVVAIGRDTRRSGSMLEAAFAAGAASEGANVDLVGVIPTAAVALATGVLSRHGGAVVVGVVISASHNPFADNGIKLFAPGGRKLTDEVQHAIEDELALMLAAPPQTRSGADVGELFDDHSLAQRYVDWSVGLLAPDALAGLTIVADTAHGAAVDTAPAVLRALGAKVMVIGDAPTGININDHVGATYPDVLAAAVVERQADLGLAFDGDADRLIAVDHTGAIVDGDQLIAITALDRRANGRLAHDTVVVTVMTNLGFHRAMAAANINVAVTAVGDRYVMDELERGGFVLGGEQSGHIIATDIAPTGDGLVSALGVLGALVRSGQTLHDAASVVRRLPQTLVNVKVAATAAEVNALIADQVAAAAAKLGDDGRILVRPSGTEPLLRIMVEAPTMQAAEQIASALAQAAGTATPTAR
jgi:phosphoglucosamine mutase